MIFTIFQNQALKNNHGAVNKLGWEGAAAQFPSIHCHLEMTMGCDTVAWKPEYREFYTPVSTVVIDEHIGSKEITAQLERVFGSANGHGQEHDDYANFGKAHSLSVGDLVLCPNGDYYVVAGCGFEKVEV